MSLLELEISDDQCGDIIYVKAVGDDEVRWGVPIEKEELPFVKANLNSPNEIADPRLQELMSDILRPHDLWRFLCSRHQPAPL